MKTREELKLYHQQYHAANPKRGRMRMRAWRRKQKSLEARPAMLEKRRSYRKLWKRRNGERVTATKLKALAPHESLFKVFTPLDANPDFQRHILSQDLDPLRFLMLKEDCLARAA